MSLKFGRLEHLNIDRKVYRLITEQIVSGVLTPGTRITEEELAREMGVSRTPVREAMKRLAQDELVELLPRRGMFVKKLSREDVAEIYEIRMSLEGLAASLAVPRISEADLMKLKAMDELATRELSVGRLDSCLKLDSRLHSVIAKSCGNRRLAKTLNSLNNLITYFRNEVARKQERAVEALEEHRRVIAAVEARNAGQAETAMKAHVMSARKNILRDIDFGSGGISASCQAETDKRSEDF